MSYLKVIKTNKEYEAALLKLEKLFDSKPGTEEGDEAELLLVLIQDYERTHYSIEAPDPIEAIKFRMEQMNLKQVDLVKYFGSESRISEVFNGKRTLTLNMIAALHSGLNIPLESLIRDKAVKRKRRKKYSSVEKPSLASEPKISYKKKRR